MVIKFIKPTLLAIAAVTVASCSDATYLQQETPNKLYKDYQNPKHASVVGIGEPISKRRMAANATLKVSGFQTLEDMMRRVAGTYNLAVRYGDGVRKARGEEVVINELTFDESRNYIEDVYEVQIVREGERRLLVLPSLDEPRIEKFEPGQNVSLSQFVRGLARQCDYNLVIAENKRALSSTFVTASFEDITCRDAFEAVLAPHGLALRDSGDHYSIGGFPTKQWALNLYEPVRSESSGIAYSSTSSGEGESATVTSGGTGSIESSKERNLWEELKTDLEQMVEKHCEEYKDNLSSSASEDPEDVSTGGDDEFSCGYVRINPTVGLVQMTAPQSMLDKADEIIHRVEEVASRRLLVEARIIAVSKDHSFERGGNLAGSIDEKVSFATSTGSTGSNITSLLSNVVLGGFEADNTTGGSIGIDTGDIDSVVKFAESFGTTYQLMRPTMELMDRQRAVMIDGRNEVYFIAETEDGDEDSGEGDTVTFTEKFQFVGIQFSVVAQVAEEGQPHTLAVQIPMTDIERFVPNPSTDIAEGASQIPVVTTRVIDQKVRLHDGEIKVIGGLTRRTAIDRDTGVPLLRHTPVAGNLLEEERITYQDLEFVVLLQAKRIY